MLLGINRNQKQGGTEVWHVPKPRTEASQREATRLESASPWACFQLAQGLGFFFPSLSGLRRSPIKRRACSLGNRSQSEVSRIPVCDINRLLCEKHQEGLEKIQPAEVSKTTNNRNFGTKMASEALQKPCLHVRRALSLYGEVTLEKDV